MTEAKNVLKADFTFSDEPLEIDDIEGLPEAVKATADDKEKRLVRCEGRVSDYDVYWNSKTDSVRVAAKVPAASYEVPQEFTNGENDE